MVATSNFSAQLAAIRERAARRRSEAFVDYQPVIFGMVLEPVTLKSYNRLIAFDNAFACGGPLSVEAVIGWAWVHHRDFGQMAGKSRAIVFRRVWRALHPRFPNLNAFLHLVSSLPGWRWLRRFRRPTEGERITEAVGFIRHLMDEALYGFPASGGNDEDRETDKRERALEAEEAGKPAPVERYEPHFGVTFQAQVLNTFRRDYGMSYAETESMPLRKLGQLWREHLWATSSDKTGLKLMDREEAKLWASALKD